MRIHTASSFSGISFGNQDLFGRPICKSEWEKSNLSLEKAFSMMVLQSACYIFVTVSPAWNFQQTTETPQPAARPYHPVCSKPADREPERARVRQIAPPGHIYVIIMTRVNRSIIKKPCLLFPSGRKWISVSASQRDSPQERQNWRFQLLGALHVLSALSQICLWCLR